MTGNNHIHWSNERRKLSQLHPWERNPRQIKTDQARRLVESFDQFGQVETVAIGPDGQIYNGHQRLNVLMQQYGPDYEVDVRVASRELIEKEREKLTVFLHKGAAGEWNFDILANEFELDELLEWGFNEKELDLNLWAGDAPEDPGAQMDKAEELREKWGVETGQLWQLGEHRLICGDCTDKAVVERVMGGDKAGAVVTDPPYGIDLDTEYSKITGSQNSIAIKQGKKRVIANNYEKVEGDQKPFDASLFVKLFEYVHEQFWFGANYYRRSLSDNDMDGSWLVWDKRPSANRDGGEGIDDVIGSGFELIWSKNKHQQRVLRYQWSGFTARNPEFERAHPTEKPLALLGEILERWTKMGMIIFDGFLGSGTTMAAAQRLGRRCFGIEIDPKYCAVAIQRWVDMTGREPTLLEPQTLTNYG